MRKILFIGGPMDSLFVEYPDGDPQAAAFMNEHEQHHEYEFASLQVGRLRLPLMRLAGLNDSFTLLRLIRHIEESPEVLEPVRELAGDYEVSYLYCLCETGVAAIGEIKVAFSRPCDITDSQAMLVFFEQAAKTKSLRESILEAGV